MSPPTSGANPRGPTYAGRASPRPSPPLPLESKSGSVRQRIAAATHHGEDEIAAQPRPRYFKMAPPALIRRNQRTSSVPVAGRTASYARPPQRASVRKPSISAGPRAFSRTVPLTQSHTIGQYHLRPTSIQRRLDWPAGSARVAGRGSRQGSISGGTSTSARRSGPPTGWCPGPQSSSRSRSRTQKLSQRLAASLSVRASSCCTRRAPSRGDRQ